MKLHFLLWLFLSLLLVTHCQEKEDDLEDEEGVGGEGGDDVDLYQGMEDHEESDEEEQPDDEDDDPDFEPLTSEQMRTLHKKMDANSNGKVSLAEVNDYAHAMRRAIAKLELDDVMRGKDTDKDGKLTFDEFLGDPGRVPEEKQNEKVTEFKELDLNEDKLVDIDELASVYHHHTNEKVEATLAKIAMADKDANQDGKLTLEEFMMHLQQEGEEPVEIGEEDKEVFSKLDLDNDGTLSLKELQAWESGAFHAEEAVRKLFLTADKDKDNQLTADEMDEAKHDIHSDTDIDAQMHLTQWHDTHKEKNEL